MVSKTSAANLEQMLATTRWERPAICFETIAREELAWGFFCR